MYVVGGRRVGGCAEKVHVYMVYARVCNEGGACLHFINGTAHNMIMSTHPILSVAFCF